MKKSTESRINSAKEVSKEILIETIKTSDPTRFDQMLIESEERKTYYYVKYKALAYTREPKTLKFPLFKDLVNDFERTIEHSGEAKILEDDRIIQKVTSKGYSPIETRKYAGKNLVFSELKLVTENDKVKLKQPFYYLPSETDRHTCGTCNGDKYTTCTEYECHGQHIYDCNKCRTSGKIDCEDCNARGEYTCPSCNGRGALKCSSCGGSGRERSSNNIYSKCKSCNGSGERKCSSVNTSGGLSGLGVGNLVSAGIKKGFGNEYCGGSGIIRCGTCSATGKITCDKCKGDGRIECQTCYGDHVDNRYGKVDCKTCETAGELASISYIETEIKSDNLDLFFTDKTKIDAPGFGLETIKQFANANGQLIQTYKSLNGDNKENYDEYSTFCSQNALAEVGDYKDRYPKLISEEMYYEGVPCATYNYNHVLSATFHDVSVLNIDKTKEVLFHSNPADVAKEKESFKDKVNEWLRQAFSTKTFKDKIDRKHEMFLMVHMAKADGVIEEQEKRYLSQIITGLHGFTQKEKAELFGLMSATTLPPILPTNAYFSSKERAEEARVKIVELVAKADGEYEPEEKAKLEEINKAIELGYKAKPSAFGRFFKTWQISIPLLLIVLGISIGTYWFVIVYPVQQARSLHNSLLLEEKKIQQMLENGTDDNSDTYFSKYSTQSSISKLNHNSELTIEGNKSYKKYWSEKQAHYLSLLDEIPDDIEDAIEESDKPKQETKEKVEDFENTFSYTVSDPDGWSNLRETPNGEVLTKVYEGDLFKVIETEGKYKKVELEDGTIGYIHSSRVVSI